MDYFNLVKRAWAIIWKNKWLWGLGVLAALGASGGGSSNFQSSGFQSLPEMFKNNNGNQGSSLHLGRVLGANTSQTDIWQKIGDFMTGHVFWIVLFGILLFVLLIALKVIAISANGGLVNAVNKIEKKEETNFSAAFSAGFSRFWSLLGLSILIGLIIMAILLVFGVPAIALAFIPKVGYIFAIILGIIGFLALLLTGIFLNLVYQIALRKIMIEGEGAIKAAGSGYKLAKEKLGNVFIVWLISLLLGFAYGVVVLIIAGVIGLPLVFLGIAIAFASKVVLVIYIILAVILFLAVTLFLSGVFQSFLSTYWTLAYLEISKK